MIQALQTFHSQPIINTRFGHLEPMILLTVSKAQQKVDGIRSQLMEMIEKTKEVQLHLQNTLLILLMCVVVLLGTLM